MGFEYFVPNWKMFPTSMPLVTFKGLWHCGQSSPASTSLKSSTTDGKSTSTPQFAPTKCLSVWFMPITKFFKSATVLSATILTLYSSYLVKYLPSAPLGPINPGIAS